MDELSFLTGHYSVPAKQLGEPAPSDTELEQILQAAMSAPDHGGLAPFRFMTIQGQARHQLAEVFGQATLGRDPAVDEAYLQKQQAKPLRSPLIIVVIARIEQNPQIPEIEQILSAGCAAQHIQLASRALGYGSIWLTGDNCYDLNVHQALGLDIDERIIGFIYVGTPKPPFEEKPRSPSSAVTTAWESPHNSDFAI
ncbi:MAG: nitroreductase [Gammaproteobacteria bacterium]|nr:nitroreductase [Gammaproteobacteria bacterium]